jgi:hypothetical protein
MRSLGEAGDVEKYLAEMESSPALMPEEQWASRKT